MLSYRSGSGKFTVFGLIIIIIIIISERAGTCFVS